VSRKSRPNKRTVKPNARPSSHVSSRPSRALLGAAAGVALVTVLTFADVRHFDFVDYDDFEFVVENSHVATGLSLANLRWAFENAYSGTGGPLTWLSHMLDVEFFGLAAGGHHVTSLVLHTLSALVVLAALYAATGSTSRSAVVAALFAVHPLHVESVAWIAQRKDVLSGFFWFATTAAYIGYARRPGAWRYGSVVALFALGLMSKPMVVTLPFVLLLMDVWPLRRLPLDRAGVRQLRRLLFEKTPLLVLGAFVLILTLSAQQQLGAVSTLDAIPAGTRLANATVSYVAYLGKMFWPVGLIPYYPYRTSMSPAVVTAAAALLVALTIAALGMMRRAPFVSVGWLWYLGTLVPVIGLVQVGGHAMADRFTYLPLTGVFIALVWGLPVLLRRVGVPDRAMLLAAVLVIAACAVTARAQTRHWENGLALWEHTVRVDPDNARAYSNLGVVLAGRNRMTEAIRAYEEALRLHPGVPQTLYNLGFALESTGQADAAATRYAEAIRLAPDYLKPRMQLAGLLAQSGHINMSIEHYQEAIRFHPHEPLARVNLAVSLGRSGRPAEALPHMLEAIRLEPNSAQWRYFAGMMMVEAGRTREAVTMLESALQIDPGHAEARNALRALTRSHR
jgi:protein O-mannosyl-transferase